MAKKSMLAREVKRKKLTSKFLEKRKALKLAFKKATSLQELFLTSAKLQKLPKNSSPQRIRNRCWKTGKPRGYFRFLGYVETLCEN